MLDRTLLTLTLAAGTLITNAIDSPNAPVARVAPVPHHPHDVIADFALSTNYPADPRMFVASPGTMNLFMVSTDHGLSWKHSRTGLAGKEFSRIVLAPDYHDSGIAYVLTEDRGLQISTDFGRTWPNTAFAQQHLHFLAVAPVANTGTRSLYVASHKNLFRSDDGGNTFDEVALPRHGTEIETVALSPGYTTDGVVALGMSDGRVLLSANRGGDWRVRRVGNPVMHLAFSPHFARDRQIWIATWGNGVMRSRDGGEKFTQCNEGITDLEVNYIAVANSRPGVEVFVCTRNDGVFRSSDAGTTWRQTALRIDKTVQTDNHHTKVIVSPAWPEDQTVACCTYEGLYLSRDGGATWHESNINPPRIGRHIKLSPNFATDGVAVAVGYGMQMMVSEDHGTSWDTRFAGINTQSVYSIGVSPEFAKDGIVILGVWHGVRRTTDLGKTWQAIEFPADPEETRKKVGFTARSITFSPNFADDRTVFSVSNWGVLYRSTDAGLSWQLVRRVSKFTASFAIAPDYPTDQTLFVGGGQGIWRSNDGGANFDHALVGTIAGDSVLVPPDFTQSGEVYCIDRLRGFLIGTQRGDQWQDSNAGLEGFSPAAIALSPSFADDHTIDLLAGGGGVFRSTDRGRSWSRVSERGSGVDQGFCLTLSPDFARDGTAFVGTFTGFYRTRDSGATWHPVTSTEVYDDKRDPWRRAGDGWRMRNSPDNLNRSISVSKTPGDLISIPFNGRGCRLFGARGPNFGIAEIWIDHEQVATVDCYAANEQARQVLFERALDPGHHVLTLLVTGEKHAKSRAAWTGVDAIEVTFR